MNKLLINLALWLKENEGKTVVYVAGKVTGLPYQHVYSKFKIRENYLRSKGYAVLNPCDWIAGDSDWKNAMQLCVILLSASDKINLLSCWIASEGATIEKELAEKIGIEQLRF